MISRTSRDLQRSILIALLACVTVLVPLQITATGPPPDGAPTPSADVPSPTPEASGDEPPPTVAPDAEASASPAPETTAEPSPTGPDAGHSPPPASDPPFAEETPAPTPADDPAGASPSPEPSPEPSVDPSPGASPTVSPTAAPAAPSMPFVVTFVSSDAFAARADLLAAVGATETSAIASLSLATIDVPVDGAVDLLAALQASPLVSGVDVDRERQIEAAPDDTYYDDQWALPRIGWTTARESMSPTGSAVVAILDTGIDAAHPDLAGQLVDGTSFVDGTDVGTDPNGHGTWMAGIVAAATNNGVGVAGVGMDSVKVMPVTVIGADGTGRDSDIIAGIVYATEHGADVILMAFSSRGYSAALQQAVDYAWESDVVLVAAVGNDGAERATYPAGDAGVMGVSATDFDDSLWTQSNHGDAVFLGAPGAGIMTTAPTGEYVAISGTSAAAAYVAGSAALVRAADQPALNAVIVGRLARSAAPAGTRPETGNGRLDLARALADESTEGLMPAGVTGAASGGPIVGPFGDPEDPPIYTVAAWYSGSWAYRKTITIDHTKVGATLTSFPFLVTYASDTDLAADAQDDGDDILFTSADGSTKLDHEIETFSGSTGALVAWVEVPSLSSTVDTVLYLYYGNGSAASQQNVTGVWDSNFKGVWHLDETVTDEQLTGTHNDSTSNVNNMTQGGNVTVTGKIGSAQDLDGTNDYIKRANAASLQVTSTFTLSGWVQMDAFGAGNEIDPILRKGEGSPNNYQLALHDGKSSLYVNGSDDTPTVGSSTVLSTGTWYYVVATHNSAGTSYVYLNGAQSASGVAAYVAATDTRELFIGGRDDALDVSNGRFDEVRISNTARSATWISTEYNNQNTPSTFSSTGSEGTNDSTAPTLSPTVTEGSNPGLQHFASNTLYYNPGGTGTFTVQSGASDTGGSGLDTVTFPGRSTYQEVVADSAASYWRLGETSGTSAVDARGVVNGTYTNGVTLNQTGALSGDADKAASFDGVDDYVNVGDVYDFAGTASFSVEAWFKKDVNAASTYMRVVDKNNWNSPRNGWQLEIQPESEGADARKIGFSRWAGGSTNYAMSTTLTGTGTWYHVVGTYDGTNLRIYVNGVLEATTASSLSMPGNALPLRIGQSAAGYEFFDGTIDDVAIYSSALGASAIQEHYWARSSAAMPTGFTHTAIERSTTPWDSNTYTFDATNTTAPSAHTITALDGSGNQGTSTITFVRDVTAPTGHSVSLVGGPYYSSLSVPLNLGNGTDSQSGVNTSSGVVQRASATLTTGTCGTFGSYSTVTLSGGADTTVTTGNCYRYTYRVSDNVGNQSAASAASADAKVDTTAPSAPTLSYSAMTNVVASGNVLRYLPGSAGGLTVTASSTDAQSAIASYGFPTLPAGWTVSGSGASRSWTYTINPTAPSGNQNVSANNNSGLSATSAFTLAPDTRPVAVANSYSVNEDATLAPNAATGVLANDTDAESDTLTAMLVTNVTYGSLTLYADGSFSYTPTANYNGSDSFTYKANDGWFDSASNATVSITVNPVNDPPVGVADSYSMYQGNTLVVAAAGVLANDTDVDLQALTVQTPRPLSGPSNGSLTLNADGSFSYTPSSGFSGADSFTYKATDGAADSLAATVTITVTSTAYISSSTWTSSFSGTRYLDITYPGYLPSGATVVGATFRHSYRSFAGGTTCYYVEAWSGGVLIGSHGSSGSPLSCNAGTTYVTDTVALPEVNSVARANSLTLRLFVRNSASGKSEHSMATLGVDYWLGNP